MKFFWSAESDWRVDGSRLRELGHFAVKTLTELAQSTSLQDVDIKVAYIPIIVGDDLKRSYPARTRKNTRRRVAQCAPQLDHDRFVNGTAEDQVYVFFDGLLDAVKPLKSFDLSEPQILEYCEIVHAAKQAALSELL